MNLNKKKLFSINEILKSLLSIKKGFFFSFCIYFIGIFVGIILFRNKTYTIHKTNLKFIHIFFNNYKLGILIIVTGLITIGILSTLIIFCNGIILGDILVGVYNKYNLSPIFTGVAPHFIFEVFALCIATSISYESIKIVRFLFNEKYNNKIHISRLLTNFILMTILFIVAAVIEVNIAHI